MRQSSDGRDTVPAWCYASTGQRVFGAIDGCPGTVVSVDRANGYFEVEWTGQDISVVYPEDTTMVRAGPSVGITDPLPLRNCSRCENWVREYAMATADDKERVSAVCIIHRKRTYGSDTCGDWTKQ